jgi:hypothetical protein
LIAIRRTLAAIIVGSAALTGLVAGQANARSNSDGTETIYTGPIQSYSDCIYDEGAYTNTVPFTRLGCYYGSYSADGVGWYYAIKIAVPGLPVPPH